MAAQSESGFPRAVDISSTGQPDNPLIRTGASGGNGGGDMTSDRAYVDAKTEAVEARISASLATIGAKIDTVTAKLDEKPSRSAMYGTVALAAAAGLGILFTVFQIAGSSFGTGAQVTAVSVEQAVEANRLAQENARQIELLIDLLGNRIEQ